MQDLVRSSTSDSSGLLACPVKLQVARLAPSRSTTARQLEVDVHGVKRCGLVSPSRLGLK
jgi:hypothetical protein